MLVHPFFKILEVYDSKARLPDIAKETSVICSLFAFFKIQQAFFRIESSSLFLIICQNRSRHQIKHDKRLNSSIHAGYFPYA